MIDLDNSQSLYQLDTHQVLHATSNLWAQCEQAWNESVAINLPSEYQQINHVVIAGMGGSHLGGDLVKSIFYDSLKLPITIKSNYITPGYVNEHSLVIATSYSGNTEEILSFAQNSLEKEANLILISSGGKLADFAHSHQLPCYIFDDSKYNPHKIPRYGSGYLFMSQLAILSKIHDLEFSQEEALSLINFLKNQLPRYAPGIPEKSNISKHLASKLYGKTVNIVSSEHLTGAAYIFKNQLNESSKNLSYLFEIPELNHHLLEGLSNPQNLKDNHAFIFFESNQYHPRNQKRSLITQEIINRFQIPCFQYKPESTNKLHQAFEVLSFSSYTAIYLSFLNHVEAGTNPWVDYLKQQMSHS